MGEAEVGAGGGSGAACTENPLTRLPLCASWFVTVTVREPTAAAPLIVTLAVIDVLELKMHVLAMPAPKLHVGRSRNPVPTISTLTLVPCVPTFGVTLVIVGGSLINGVTVKPSVNVPTCVSGLVTVTLRTPVVAA